MKPVHEDERRAIREAEVTLPNGAIRRVTHLAIKGSGVLGNHYHPTQPEYFTVLGGEPTVLKADHEKPADIRVREFPKPGLVTVQPGETHTFIFDKPGDLIATQDGAFDESQLVPQKLELPTKK